MEISSQNDSFAVFWIKTGEKIYKWTFLGTCAPVTLKSGFYKKSPAPYNTITMFSFIQKVRSLGETLTNGPFTMSVNHSSKLAYALCSVLKKPWAFPSCLLFVGFSWPCLTFDIFTWVLGSQERGFWLGLAENTGRKTELWHRTGTEDFKSEFSWKIKQML